jgi:hypothetical protein
MAGAASPYFDEKIVVGVDDGNDITGEIWDDTAWEALPFNPLASVSVSYYWAFEVAYEQSSGDAVMVWNNGTNGTNGLSFRVWDGLTWTAEDNISAPVSGEPRQMKLAAQPGADEMVLVVNADGTDYALVWDGAAWGDAQVLDASVGETDIYAAYEQESSRAMVVFAKDGDPNGYYRIWDGASWGAEGEIAPPVSEDLAPRWMTLGADPGSDRIALGVVTYGASLHSDVWVATWTGSEWEPATTGTTAQIEDLSFPNVAVAFESASGEALAVYSPNGTAVNTRYRTWNDADGWSEAITGPGLGAPANSLMLYPAPSSNAMMLVAQNGVSEMWFSLWNGAEFGGAVLLETNTAEVTGQPFLFLWSQI